MQSIGQTKEIVVNLLKYKNPFEIRDFLLSSKVYSSLYQDESFWQYMLKEVYDISYVPDTPRTEFFRLYIKDNYTVDTKVRELPEKYHWVAYINYINKYLSAEMYVFSPELLYPDTYKNMSRDQFKEFKDAHDKIYSYMKDISSSILSDIKKGKTVAVLYTEESDYVYLGDINNISIESLFALNDPLDKEVSELMYRNDTEKPRDLDYTIGDIFSNNDIQYLGLQGFRSYIPNRDTRDALKVPSIRKFRDIKLEEGKSQDILETLRELIFIGNNIQRNDYSGEEEDL